MKITRWIAVLTLGISSLAIAETGRLLDAMPPTMVAQNFSLADTNGDVVSLEDFKGSFVMVNFWATSCLVCQAELPVLQSLADQLTEDEYDFKVIAIHAGADLEGIKEVLKDNPVDYPIVLDSNLQLGHWGIPRLPTTYILGPEGNFLYRAVGERVWTAPSMVDFLKNVMDSH